MIHRPFAAVVTMCVLAGLDLVGAVIARRYSHHRSAAVLLLGCAAFAVMFVVYARGLQSAELTTITFGWVVLLQVGVVILDRLHQGRGLPADRIIVVVALLVLQGYLLLAPTAA